MKIQALHEFHNAEFSREWTEKFKPTAPRIKLFETILKQIAKLECDTLAVLELGIGPGFLAGYLLDRLPGITYEGLDNSKSMLEIAKKRTEKHHKRIHFIKADMINEEWDKAIQRRPHVIVSTWALHDLLSKKNIKEVYKSAYGILNKGGFFINGDFIKPEDSKHDYEGGRIKPSEHLALLRKVGFEDSVCLEEYEKSVENPTTSNNYACFMAKK